MAFSIPFVFAEESPRVDDLNPFFDASRRIALKLPVDKRDKSDR
jgi:hypothetical protein